MQVLFLDRNGKYALVEMKYEDLNPVIYMHDVRALRTLTISEFAKSEDELIFPEPRIRSFERRSQLEGVNLRSPFPVLPIYIEVY